MTWEKAFTCSSTCMLVVGFRWDRSSCGPGFLVAAVQQYLVFKSIVAMFCCSCFQSGSAFLMMFLALFTVVGIVDCGFQRLPSV